MVSSNFGHIDQTLMHAAKHTNDMLKHEGMLDDILSHY